MIKIFYLVLIIGGGNGTTSTITIPQEYLEACNRVGTEMIGTKILDSAYVGDIRGYTCVKGVIK